MSESLRWVLFAGLAHVLTDDTAGVASFLTLCTREVAFTASVYRVAPSLDVCRICQRISGFDALSDFPIATPTVF